MRHFFFISKSFSLSFADIFFLELIILLYFLKELKDIYETLTRYYPETLFLEDLDKKMNRVTKEIALLENNNTATTK